MYASNYLFEVFVVGGRTEANEILETTEKMTIDVSNTYFPSLSPTESTPLPTYEPLLLEFPSNWSEIKSPLPPFEWTDYEGYRMVASALKNSGSYSTELSGKTTEGFIYFFGGHAVKTLFPLSLLLSLSLSLSLSPPPSL